MLDALADWVAPGSVDDDFGVFKVFIESSGSFPLMSHEGLPFKPGFNNIITLTRSLVNSKCQTNPQESVILGKPTTFFKC
jgi:hypothetical protein